MVEFNILGGALGLEQAICWPIFLHQISGTITVSTRDVESQDANIPFLVGHDDGAACFAVATPWSNCALH
jgi:hypothetical protein